MGIVVSRWVLATSYWNDNKLVLQIDKYCDLTRDDLIVGRPDGGERRDEEAVRVRSIVVLGNFGKEARRGDECDRVGKNDECDRQMSGSALSHISVHAFMNIFRDKNKSPL
jgi:hypothetical protein